ncbi:MAG TPA: tetratricopeptide repeat protein [Pyrinomonadaceae bacterium]|jgi:tetratricopeptide (TPR) repeat protein|nr:tetratricopeptide repeat protein [Pyrinomonadaceae bacterium]
MKIYSRLLLVGLIAGLSFSGVVAQTQTDGDTVAQLREQIAAASMIQDRNRLQLKLAEELVKTGYKTEALTELFQILNGNGFDPIGYYNLGNAFARLDESDSAIMAYQRAIEQRKGNYSRAQNNLGVVLLREGRWDEAYDAFNAALRIENFRYAEASYNLGRLYAARGQSDLAVREWRRALAVDSKHSAAAQAIARGEDEPEIVVAKSSPAPRDAKPEKRTPAPATSVKAAAAPRPAKALALDQMSFDFLQRARAASERGKTQEAIDNFRRVLNRQNGYFPPANLELSYALLSLKRYDEAEAQLLQVSQRDGARYPVSYFHLARLYELKGELKRAEAAFSQVVDAYGPTNSQFLLDLSRVREKQGDFKGAVEAMERYVKLSEQQGLKPAWSDQRLAELRAKAQ